MHTAHLPQRRVSWCPNRAVLQGIAAREKRPQLVSDACLDRRLSPRIHAMNERWGTRSWAVIPLMHKGTTIGSLLLAAKTPGAFTETDVEPMVAISEFVSALIGNQSELSMLLNHVITENDQRGQGAVTARFVASVMLPEAMELESQQVQLDALLAQPNVLRAVFQPIVHLANRRTVGYEGLTSFPASTNLTPTLRGAWAEVSTWNMPHCAPF
ncbi:GAF domain-containing protein [Mycobacterium sp. CVI_P3]|uniref:GAF domain-containing protein n=1 Tax=Mycobacterium pinniadriaticum TaxID=2994102 RepID=A0ABT3SJT4_9MYCO|nr:GAF domain-containing protein [Mycobacterium pinniadriaticum]MCX2932910.1 GAF domain-containing protein [Mycobacterium pinniadriaticum]MCX2939418.1 GAF domain-containing protein [Mycobacterium pinniadriaticum]